MKKITTVIFDIGNVLAEFPWREYLRDFQFPLEVEEKIARTTFLGKNWAEADRGAKSDEEIYEDCLREIPELEKELKQVWENRAYIVKEYPYATSWIKNLKSQGYQVYLLSNYGKTTFEEAQRSFEFLKYPDGRVISYEIQAIKPEPKIYEELIQKYHLIPEQCVFLDDLADNIKQAEVFGFHTIQFYNKEQAIKDMECLGIYLEGKPLEK